MLFSPNHDPNYFEEHSFLTNCGSFAFNIQEWYSPDDRFVEEIMEKPVSQWNGEEIRRYASIKGIDLTGVRTTKQARSAVIAYNNEVERKASIG